jgi:hypothetical protein
MSVKYLWSAAGMGLLLHTGCGGDDTNASAGTGGTSATAGNTAVGGAFGSAGGLSIPDVITMLTTPMCDSNAQSEASCGSTQCPALPDNAGATCTINCCASDGRCGTRSADTRVQQLLGTTCTPPVTPDERCPGSTVLGMTLTGCCDGQGNCGQILGPLCLAGGTPRACNAPPETDAGL